MLTEVKYKTYMLGAEQTLNRAWHADVFYYFNIPHYTTMTQESSDFVFSQKQGAALPQKEEDPVCVCMGVFVCNCVHVEIKVKE